MVLSCDLFNAVGFGIIAQVTLRSAPGHRPSLPHCPINPPSCGSAPHSPTICSASLAPPLSFQYVPSRAPGDGFQRRRGVANVAPVALPQCAPSCYRRFQPRLDRVVNSIFARCHACVPFLRPLALVPPEDLSAGPRALRCFQSRQAISRCRLTACNHLSSAARRCGSCSTSPCSVCKQCRCFIRPRPAGAQVHVPVLQRNMHTQGAVSPIHADSKFPLLYQGQRLCLGPPMCHCIFVVCV